MYLERVLETIAEEALDRTLDFDYAGQVKGCSPEEVAELERRVGLKLPAAYKEFLLWSGHGLGRFEMGSRFYYDDILETQEIAREILAEPMLGKPAFPQKLPDDAFVFWMHEGYMFTFFRTSEGDNPPVHFYRESFTDDFAWNHQQRFTDFLIVEMRDQARHIENAKQIEERLARDWRNA